MCRSFALAALCLVAAACERRGTPPPAPEGPDVIAPIVTETTIVVGPEGQGYPPFFVGRASLTFPPGSVTVPTAITVRTLLLERSFPSGVVDATARFYEPAVFQILPADLVLARPARLEVSYGSQKRSQPEIFHSELKDTTWQRAGLFEPPLSDPMLYQSDFVAALPGPGLWTWLFNEVVRDAGARDTAGEDARD